MKKFLFILLISIFLIPSVNAETPSADSTLTCSNTANLWNASLTPGKVTATEGQPLSFTDLSDSTYKYVYASNYVKVDPSTTYTLSYWNKSPAAPGNAHVYYLDGDYNYLSKLVFPSSSYGYHNHSFTTPEDANYILLYFGQSAVIAGLIEGNGTSIIFQLSQGEVTLTSLEEYVDYEACPVVEEPDESVVPDATLDNFYSIYTSKLQALAQYASENKFILSAIAIIMLVVILELILNLFRRGGYR